MLMFINRNLTICMLKILKNFKETLSGPIAILIINHIMTVDMLKIGHA